MMSIDRLGYCRLKIVRLGNRRQLERLQKVRSDRHAQETAQE